ncbi:MAG: hypothetical protein ACRES9_10165 [Gammaproteobacteria bacterium]
MKKRSKFTKNPFLSRETLREKWRRELAQRRVDAAGMEPIRLRVRTLLKRRQAHSQTSK